MASGLFVPTTITKLRQPVSSADLSDFTLANSTLTLFFHEIIGIFPRQRFRRDLICLSELEGRSDVFRQFSPELTGDPDRRPGSVVVGHLRGSTNRVFYSVGPVDGVVEVP